MCGQESYAANESASCGCDECCSLAWRGQPEESGGSAGGPQDAIKVHGHWTIDVRKRGGTLVEHREFENSVTADGSLFLARLLERQSVPGEWGIELWTNASVSGPSVCADPIGRIGDPEQHCTDTESTGLHVVEIFLVGNPQVSLTGTIVFSGSTQILAVATQIPGCAGTILPASCRFTIAHYNAPCM
jgi:hypothetical protein